MSNCITPRTRFYTSAVGKSELADPLEQSKALASDAGIDGRRLQAGVVE